MTDTNLSGVCIHQPFLGIFLGLLLRVFLNQSKLCYLIDTEKRDEIKKSRRIWTPVFLSQATYSPAILNPSLHDNNFEKKKKKQIDLAFADDK